MGTNCFLVVGGRFRLLNSSPDIQTHNEALLAAVSGVSPTEVALLVRRRGLPISFWKRVESPNVRQPQFAHSHGVAIADGFERLELGKQVDEANVNRRPDDLAGCILHAFFTWQWWRRPWGSAFQQSGKASNSPRMTVLPASQFSARLRDGVPASVVAASRLVAQRT